MLGIRQSKICHHLFIFGFYILQLGMMGTSVIYSSGDTGVAGRFNETSICMNSERMLRSS